MKQYICDRCGARIPLYSGYNHVILYDKGIRNANIEYEFNNRYNEYDLCDDCLEYLHNMNQAFIENRELFVK